MKLLCHKVNLKSVLDPIITSALNLNKKPRLLH